MIMFANRLAKVHRHLGKHARRLGITCYRVYDHDLPEFPLCLEIYDDKLYVAEYKRRHNLDEAGHDEWLNKSLKLAAETLGLPGENIYMKVRQRKAGRLGQYKKIEESRHEFVVRENGLKFIVNLSDYLDTGLFLDHRTTRQMVRDESRDKNVLNLFAYTGSFSVYAAAGGAARVVTVDLSNTYLDWAKRNMALNGFTDAAVYDYVQADIKQYLKTIPEASFDLVIMDPPTFSNSKRMDDFLDIQRDHVELINDCLNGVKKGGSIIFSTNYRKFNMEIEKIRADTVKDITKSTLAFDFEGRFSRFCFRIIK